MNQRQPRQLPAEGSARTSTRMTTCSATSINQRACIHRFRHSADPLPRNDRFSALFTQWVCTLASTPPQLPASPPPNGGNCTIRTTTRRRHAASQLLVVQNPPPLAVRRTPEGPDAASAGGGRTATGHTQPHFRYKTRPAAPSRRMRGTKLALLAQKGPIWQVLRTHGELCTAVARKKPCRANFVPHARRRRG